MLLLRLSDRYLLGQYIFKLTLTIGVKCDLCILFRFKAKFSFSISDIKKIRAREKKTCDIFCAILIEF